MSKELRPIGSLSDKQASQLFECEDHTVRDYQCLDQITSEVVVIDSLPAGIGQRSQKLDQPIEVIKTHTIDVGDQLDIREVLPVKMISVKEAEELMRSGKFSKEMIPSKIRQCRSCNEPLPESHHLNCRKCVPSLPEDAGEYLYSGVSGE